MGLFGWGKSSEIIPVNSIAANHCVATASNVSKDSKAAESRSHVHFGSSGATARRASAGPYPLLELRQRGAVRCGHAAVQVRQIPCMPRPTWQPTVEPTITLKQKVTCHPQSPDKHEGCCLQPPAWPATSYPFAESHCLHSLRRPLSPTALAVSPARPSSAPRTRSLREGWEPLGPCPSRRMLPGPQDVAWPACSLPHEPAGLLFRSVQCPGACAEADLCACHSFIAADLAAVNRAVTPWVRPPLQLRSINDASVLQAISGHPSCVPHTYGMSHRCHAQSERRQLTAFMHATPPLPKH